MAKAWSWSFSKLKNYETCPKRHYEIDIARHFTEKVEEGGPLDWGNRVHNAFAAALKNNTALTEDMVGYQHWLDRVRAGSGKLMIEQKYAITKDFAPTMWSSPVAWCRGVGDVVRINGPVGLILDWKTGKLKKDTMVTYGPQLVIMAQCLFAHFPDLQRVRSEFVWLQEDCSTPETYTRQDIADAWAFGLLDKVHAMENASKTLTYPPLPGGLCKNYCPVTSCPYHGKGSR